AGRPGTRPCAGLVHAGAGGGEPGAGGDGNPDRRDGRRPPRHGGSPPGPPRSGSDPRGPPEPPATASRGPRSIPGDHSPSPFSMVSVMISAAPPPIVQRRASV